MFIVNDLIEVVREIAGDTATPYAHSDISIIRYIDRAQIVAAESAGLLHTNDMKIGDIQAVCTIIVNGTSGTISAITVDGTDQMITNPVSFLTNANVTATNLTAEINSTGKFIATRLDNVITVKAKPGLGAHYNDSTPVITQTAGLAFVQAGFSGGVDGICRISLKPGQKEYKISPNIIRIHNYRLGDLNKHLCVQSEERVNQCNYPRYNEPGPVFTILYSSGLYDLNVAQVPDKKDYIRLTVDYRPLIRLKNKTDVFELQEMQAMRLENYVLFQMFSKNDYEIDGRSIAAGYKNAHEQDFGPDDYGSSGNAGNIYSKFEAYVERR